MNRSAKISSDGRYRYKLIRQWGDGIPLTIVMLNPSTADAEHDDPTIRKCMGFARRWNNVGICVLNLYGFRATSPRDLFREDHPIGPGNDIEIFSTIRAAGKDGLHPVLCAWGDNAEPERVRNVMRIIQLSNGSPFCLGWTKRSQPMHPLYRPYESERQPFYVHRDLGKSGRQLLSGRGL